MILIPANKRLQDALAGHLDRAKSHSVDDQLNAFVMITIRVEEDLEDILGVFIPDKDFTVNSASFSKFPTCSLLTI